MNCIENELVPLAREVFEFIKANGNRPIEVLNIAAQMSVILSQLAIAARGQP